MACLFCHIQSRSAVDPFYKLLSYSDRKLTVFSTIGQTVYDVDLKATPRVPVNEGSITTFKRIDAAMCGPKGLTVVIGNHYYIFESPKVMMMAKMMPEQHRVSQELFGCDH